MQEIELSPNFYAEPSEVGFSSGKIYHVKRNEFGGSLSTPVGRFFVSEPALRAEGFFPHKRLDCFFSRGDFVTDPQHLAQCLFDALRREEVIDEPAWIGWHSSEEIGGVPLGEVYDFD